MGYGPWGHKESDRTEQLTLSTFSLRTIDLWAQAFGLPSVIQGV